MRVPTTCPRCNVPLIPFAEFDSDRRADLEGDPSRQRQSVAHRRENHTICPECTIEIHGCGQPYAIPDPTPATGD